MSRWRPLPIVRPAQFAQGGAAADAFGGSGAPAVPRPGSRRAREIALQYADDERGRFTERIFEFPTFATLLPGGDAVTGAQDFQQVEITSNRTSFVRLVAIRGVLVSTSQLPLTGLELAQLKLRLQINGEEDLTTGGQVSLPSSFAILFANTSAPWFWFACPPRLRVGDLVQCVVTNQANGETGPDLQPEVALRIVDDEWWRALYGYDEDNDGQDGQG